MHSRQLAGQLKKLVPLRPSHADRSPATATALSSANNRQTERAIGTVETQRKAVVSESCCTLTGHGAGRLRSGDEPRGHADTLLNCWHSLSCYVETPTKVRGGCSRTPAERQRWHWLRQTGLDSRPTVALILSGLSRLSAGGFSPAASAIISAILPAISDCPEKRSRLKGDRASKGSS